MCLSTIKETYDNPSTVIQSGYKEFTGTGKNLKSQQTGKAIEFDKWLVALEQQIKADDGQAYTSGFHVYEDETQVKKLYRSSSTTLIYYRKVHTRGTQGSDTVVIAKEMYVPSDKNGWPPRPNDPAPKTLVEKTKSFIAGKGGSA